MANIHIHIYIYMYIESVNGVKLSQPKAGPHFGTREVFLFLFLNHELSPIEGTIF